MPSTATTDTAPTGRAATDGTATAEVASTNMSLIGSNALLQSCSVVADVCVASGAILRSSQLQNCTVSAPAAGRAGRAGRAGAIANAVISNSVISEHVHIDGPCTITNSDISEHVHIGAGALVDNSVIGPDAGISRGECLHSLVGPFTGFHHSSLLIAALWPLGRGNLGYGCMLGSNHTGRLNDQEFWPGEGCFFGLGSMAKYPCNLIGSQYSLIASNTLLGPLQVALPFSLFAPYKEQNANLSSGRSTSSNSSNSSNGKVGSQASTAVVLPGWVLYANPYLLERAASKFKARRQAIHTKTDFELYRPTILDTVRSSLEDLRCFVAAATGSGKAGTGSTEREAGVRQSLQCLGDVYLSVEAAQKGIDAYDLLVKRYALHGLLVLAHASHAQLDNLMLDVQTQAEVLVDNNTSVSAGSTDRGSFNDVLPSTASVRRSVLSLETCGMGGIACDLNLMQYGSATTTTSNEVTSSEASANICASDVLIMPEYSLTSHKCLPHQWRVLQEVYPPAANASLTYQHIQQLIHLLRELPELENAHACAVQTCKARDDVKGVGTIPHYSVTNKSMQAAVVNEEDGGLRGDDLVVAAKRRAQLVEAAVGKLILGNTKS